MPVAKSLPRKVLGLSSRVPVPTFFVVLPVPVYCRSMTKPSFFSSARLSRVDLDRQSLGQSLINIDCCSQKKTLPADGKFSHHWQSCSRGSGGVLNQCKSACSNGASFNNRCCTLHTKDPDRCLLLSNVPLISYFLVLCQPPPSPLLPGSFTIFRCTLKFYYG